MKHQLILSCEHASNLIPKPFAKYFAKFQKNLTTHEGYDIGAKKIYETLKKLNPIHFQSAKFSRLLIDLNRTLNNPKLFPKTISELDNTQKQFILEKYYLPYFNELRDEIKNLVKQKKSVIHISVHSFTPTLNHKIRNNDIGLLYDPNHKPEKEFCELWRQQITSLDPLLRVRMNYPYLGTSDGLTKHFRNLYNPKKYLGIELEVNQRLLQTQSKKLIQIHELLRKSLQMTLECFSK